MNESVRYWIPRGLPEHLQVALSIPGEPPKTLAEHRNRLEALFMTLAEEAEDSVGPGIKDSELQERCQESQFQDRVYAISQIY